MIVLLCIILFMRGLLSRGRIEKMKMKGRGEGGGEVLKVLVLFLWQGLEKCV